MIYHIEKKDVLLYNSREVKELEMEENKYNIGIISDTACDLSEQLLTDNNIELISYYVNVDGKEYKSGKEITVHQMFELANKNKKLPKTSQVTPAKFYEYFNEYLERYDRIIYIGLGSGFSGTFSNACLAANDIGDGKVYCLDSQNLSSGEGLLVLKAAKLRRDGLTFEEIIKEVERCVPLTRTQFCLNTLQYMYYGGRCSGTTRLFGTMLNIKPIIRVVDNKMVVAKKPIGYKKALEAILEYVRADLDNIDLENIMITHCLADNEALYLWEELKKMVPLESIKETFAESIVSTHCGPRTIGILYILKK